MGKLKKPDSRSAVWPGRTVRVSSKDTIQLDRFIWAVASERGKRGWKVVTDALGAVITTADSEHGMREAGTLASTAGESVTLACILVTDIDPAWADRGCKGRGITASVVRVVEYCVSRNCFLPTLAWSPEWLMNAVEHAIANFVAGSHHHVRSEQSIDEWAGQVGQVPGGGLVRGPSVDGPAPGLCPGDAGVGHPPPEAGRDGADAVRPGEDPHPTRPAA